MNTSETNPPLEVIHRPGSRKSPPLIFVHGAWAAAWIWEENFLGYFASRGHDVRAPSLRGHGGSSLDGPIRRVRLRDMVQDVASIVAAMPRRPILIGHSMGGLIVQHVIEQHEVAAAVLLCSVPPTGIWRSTNRIARRYPLSVLRMNATLRTYPLIEDIHRAHQLIASDRISIEEFRPYHARLREDSFRAFLDMLALDLPRPTARPGRPVYVLGAEHDFLFDAHDVCVTAKAYSVEPEMLPGLDHSPTLGRGWEGAAERLAHWIESRFPDE